MSFDLVIGGILFLFVALGAWKGVVRSLHALASLIVAYALGIVGATRYGALAASTLGISPALGPAVAGTGGFLLAFLAMSIVGFFVRRWDDERRYDGSRSGADRFGGALFGGLRGVVIAGLVGYLGVLLDVARDLAPEGGVLASVPRAEGSLSAAATERAVETLVEAALGDDPAARIVARIAARPGERVRSIQALLDDPRILAVQDDSFFWTLVANGATERAINQRSLYRVSHDPELRRQLADLGLVSEQAAEDSEHFRDELRVVLGEIGPRIKGLRDDPEIQELARDPEIVEMLQAGDTLGLLTHPRIRALAEKLSSPVEAPAGDDLANR